MKHLWLLYADEDFLQNRDFADLLRRLGQARGVLIEAVLLSELCLATAADGTPYCLRNGARVQPDAVLSRQRDALVSRHLEQMGIPVFNNARVCALCNDKRVTHQFLSGIPMPETFFLQPAMSLPPPDAPYPLVVKPACSLV